MLAFNLSFGRSICPSGVQYVLRTFNMCYARSIAFGVQGVRSWLLTRYTVTPLDDFGATAPAH